VAKFGLGIGAGLGLYWLITHVGFGGSGPGGGGLGTADGRAEGKPQPQPPAPTPLSKDDLPLLFWVEAPTVRSKLSDPSRAQADASFHLVDLGAAEVPGDQLRQRIVEALSRAKAKPPLRLDAMIARVRAGGRDDVRLMTSGGTIHGIWDDVKDALMTAGIKHWLLREEFPSDRKPGAAPKPPHWELFGKGAPDLNPDKNGHYHVELKSLSFWNVAKMLDKLAPHVSGYGDRGHYAITWPERGRGYYGDSR